MTNDTVYDHEYLKPFRNRLYKGQGTYDRRYRHNWKVWLEPSHEVEIHVERVDCDLDLEAELLYGSEYLRLSPESHQFGDSGLPAHCPSVSPGNDKVLAMDEVTKGGYYTIGVWARNTDSLKGPVKYKIKVFSPDRNNDGIGDACEKPPDVIPYEGTLNACDGVDTKATFLRDSDRVHYWKMWLQAPQEATIQVKRVDCNLEPKVSLFKGRDKFHRLKLKAQSDLARIAGNCQGREQMMAMRDKCTSGCQSGYYTVKVDATAGGSTDGNLGYEIRVSSIDRDRDGVGDACDHCPLTNLEHNVKVLSCDTGVKNMLVTGHGCSLNEAMLRLLRSCVNGGTTLSGDKTKRYKRFLTCMRQKLAEYVQGGIILTSENKKIMKCVRRVSEEKLQEVCGNTLLLFSLTGITRGRSPTGITQVVDPTTRKKRFYAWLKQGVRDMEYDESNDVIWAKKSLTEDIHKLVSFDPYTGVRHRGMLFHKWGHLRGITFVDNVLYGAFTKYANWALNHADPDGNATLVTVNTDNGDMTDIGLIGFEDIKSLTYDRENSEMWGLAGNSSYLIRVDLDTGKGAFAKAITDPQGRKLSEFGAIEFGPDGSLFGVLNPWAPRKAKMLVKIDPKTGIARKFRSTGIDFRQNPYGGYARDAGVTCFTI